MYILLPDKDTLFQIFFIIYLTHCVTKSLQHIDLLSYYFSSVHQINLMYHCNLYNPDRPGPSSLIAIGGYKVS